MPDIVIVDTDVLIDAGRGITAAIDCLKEIDRRASMAISSITQMELIVGCRNKKELQALDRFLMRFELIRLSEGISDKATDLLRQFRLSHGLLIADALIAATAIALDKHFVTKNQQDYQFIENLSLLPYPKPFSSKSNNKKKWP